MIAVVMSIGAKAQDWEEYRKNYFSWGNLVFTSDRDDFKISLRRTFMIGRIYNEFDNPKDYSHVEQYYGVYLDRKAMITVYYSPYSWRPARVLVSMEYGKGKKAKAQVMKDYREYRKGISDAKNLVGYTGFEFISYNRKGKIIVNPGEGSWNEHLLHIEFQDLKNMRYLEKEARRQQLLGN